MAIYAIATIPMILTIVEENSGDISTKTAAYADDFSSAGNIRKLKSLVGLSLYHWSKGWLFSRK